MRLGQHGRSIHRRIVDYVYGQFSFPSVTVVSGIVEWNRRMEGHSTIPGCALSGDMQ